jgi:hypothetical protein
VLELVEKKDSPRRRKTVKGLKQKRVENIEQIDKEIVDSTIKVHRSLGPGLLESAYQQRGSFELRSRGIAVVTEVGLSKIDEKGYPRYGLQFGEF